METAEERSKRLRESPISPLVPRICASPFKLAPENEENLLKIRDLLKIKIVPTVASEGLAFGAVVKDKVIKVGIQTLERVWGYAFAFAYIHVEVEKHGRGVWLRYPEDVKRLLYWAHKSRSNPALPWPQGASKPLLGDESPQMKLAIEYYLGACGWFLFHELGHILRDKNCYRLTEDEAGRNRIFNHAIEYGADAFACEYVMTGWRNYSPDPGVFRKRVLLIGMGLIIVAADSSFSACPPESHTHPHPIDRLERFLDSMEKDFPEMRAGLATATAKIACWLYATVCSLWPAQVLPTEFETGRQVITTCKNMFVPGALD